MFYKIFVGILKLLLLVLNGKQTVQNVDKLPSDDNYVLVAPHRTWIDPVPLVAGAYPHEFSFMGKEELRKKPILNWLIEHLSVVTVDRKNPGPSAIKQPVKILKESKKSFLIFPTGTRHSTEIKDGAVTIARLSGKAIVPAVYVGPQTFKDLLKRQKMTIRFGEPIKIEKNRKEYPTEVYNQLIQEAFVQLEKDALAQK